MVKGVGFTTIFVSGGFVIQRQIIHVKENRYKNLMLLSGTKPVSPLFSVSFLRHNCLNLCGHTNLVVSSTCSLYVQQTDICFYFCSGCLPPPSPTIPRLPFTGVLTAYRHQQHLPNVLSPTFASPKPVGTLETPHFPPYSVHGEYPNPTLPFF